MSPRQTPAPGNLTPQQRLDRIEEILRERRYVDLHSLSDALETSLSTVRRDLNDLEKKGVVRRHHGGASLVSDASIGSGYDFITQDDRQADQKHAIAGYVAQQVSDGMTIMLDGGTTTYAIARQLVGKRIVVVTNSLPVAALFNEVSSADVIVTGGSVYNRLGVLYGAMCERALNEMHADLAIMGCAGVTAEGIWNNNQQIVGYQRAMQGAADRVAFVADETKLGRRSLALTTGITKDLRLVVASAVPAPIRNAFTKGGGKVVDATEAAHSA